LAQGQVLKSELPMAAEEEGQESVARSTADVSRYSGGGGDRR